MVTQGVNASPSFPALFSAVAHGSTNRESYFRGSEPYGRDSMLFHKRIPNMRRVVEAGRRPVNRLFPVDPDTGIFAEQFGDRYVALFNPSQTETLRIAIPDAHELTTGAR